MLQLYLETKWSLGCTNYNKIRRELQTQFDWVRTWGIMNKCATSLTLCSTGLSGTHFSTLNSVGIKNREGPEKYDNTEVKYGETSYGCHTALDICCCEV
jgi:hypothetical protein